MPPVFLKSCPELASEQRLFPLCLDHKTDHDDEDTGDASPVIEHEGGTDGGEIEASVDRMAKTGIGAGADQLVILLERDAAAPELAEVVASPDGNADSRPGQSDAYRGCRGGSRQEMAVEWSKVEIAVEEHREANDFNQHDAVAREETFAAHGSSRLERADHPVGGECNPWNVYPEMRAHAVVYSPSPDPETGEGPMIPN